MIKRRFFKQDHGDLSDSSDTSSSESSSSREPEDEEEEAVEEDVLEDDDEEEKDKFLANEEANGGLRSTPPGSGYEREDSSGKEIDGDSPDLLLSDEEEGSGRGGKNVRVSQLSNEVHTEETEGTDINVRDEEPDLNDPLYGDLHNYIMKCKSAFKCRLCPRILCLSMKTVREHLKSKKHARSKKLHGEGRLKLVLNSDGEIEEEQETHAERHARTLALSQEVDVAKRKDKGRQRQRRKKKLHSGGSENGKSEKPLENAAKRRRKNID